MGNVSILLQTIPTPTPQPAQGGTDARLTIHGVACVDRDRNSQCSTDEARVPNVTVHSTDGMVTVTDNTGEYSVEAPAGTELDITIPAGYKSLNGSSRRFRIQIADIDRVDIALARDSTPVSASTGDMFQSIIEGASGNLMPVYLGLGGLTLILLILIVVLLSIRRTYQKSLTQQNQVLRDQRARDLGIQLRSEHGWRPIAEQIVADAMRQTVSIDEVSGIIDATVTPSPRFSMVTKDGCEVIFTTNYRLMKKARLIRTGDRVVDVSALSPTSHIDTNMLWHHILTSRNMAPASSPISAHWHVVVRSAPARASSRTQAQRQTMGLRLRKVWSEMAGKLQAARQRLLPRGGRA